MKWGRVGIKIILNEHFISKRSVCAKLKQLLISKTNVYTTSHLGSENDSVKTFITLQNISISNSICCFLYITMISEGTGAKTGVMAKEKYFKSQ